MPILNTLLNGFRSAAGVGPAPLRPAGRPLRRRPPLPEVSAGEGAENQRTVDALLRTGTDDLVPDIYAEEIASRGPAGRAYFRDFDRELRRRDPARANRLRGAVLDRLGDRERGMMTLDFVDADGDRLDDRREDPDRGTRTSPSDDARRPLVGPGGEGRADEAPPPPPKDDAERFRRELIGLGWTPEEADARVERHRALLAEGVDTEDGRAGRLLRTGITEASARELARTLPPEAIDQLVRDWGGLAPERRGGLVRVLTRVSSLLGGAARDAKRINERIGRRGGIGGRRK